MEFLRELNDAQRSAACISEGYLRVIAGAGSGKTKLLVSRYAYLVKALGIDPANILCVTFTNKAAGEMKRRIRALIGEGYDTSLIATYHGFCARVLREDVEKVHFPKSFQIIDTASQKELIAEIYEKLELKLDHASFEKILKLIGYVKSTPDYVARMVSSENIQIMDSVNNLNGRIVEMYLQKQKALFAVDFDDLINFALYMFERFPEIREKWQDRLNYIQVDEFQDSSAKEMQLIDILAGKYRNVMIVGDPDQNIYEWRGSDVGLLVDFDKTHPGTQTVFLNQNYRSTPQILQCANSLIEKNQFRLKKELFTLAPAGRSVIHYHGATEQDEMRYIARTVAELHRDGVKFSDIAVLYRSGFLSRVVEKVFMENAVPYEIYGGVPFWSRMEIRDSLAYLRMLLFGDDVSFKRVVNTPRRKIGKIKLARITSWQKEGQSLYEAMKENIDDPVFRGSGGGDFVALIEGLRARMSGMKVTELIDEVLSASGYEGYIRELGDMERFDNLSEFKRIAHEYERTLGEDLTLEEYLMQTALQTDDEFAEETEKVKLMTIHAAKGLEFPYVFAVGFSEGTFPSSKTVEERKSLGLEEERRLCYVAITRAREGLYLTDSEGTSLGGSKKLPSRFLREIGEENYTRIGRISKELMEESIRFAAGEEAVAAQGQIIGATINHPVFGEGKIVSEDTKTRTYKVVFSSVGERNLSREFVTVTLFAPKAEERAQTVPAQEPQQELVPPLTIPDVSSFVPDMSVPEPEPEPECPPDEVPEVKIPALSEFLSRPPEEEADFTLVIKEEEKEENTVSEVSLRTEVVGEQTEEAAERAPRTPRPLTDDPNETNLWKRSDVPHSGWVCTGITDLGEPVGTCGMCGHQIIRYVHHMHHPEYGSLGVGCICAGQMEGDPEAARRREREFKNRAARRATFEKKKWSRSRNGNLYTKIAGRHVVLFHDKERSVWRYSIDGTFSKSAFSAKEKAALAAFDEINK